MLYYSQLLNCYKIFNKNEDARVTKFVTNKDIEVAAWLI